MQSSSCCTFLKRAIKKYGKENFKIEIIKKCLHQEELDLEEEKLIKEYNSLAPNGYNLMTGGAAPKHSILTKEKMSKTRKGKHPKWATEASTSLEARQKRSESHKRLGSLVWTEKRKNKARLGASKRFKKIEDQNGNIYESITDAARITGCYRSAIQKVLKGEYKQVRNKLKESFVFKQIT